MKRVEKRYDVYSVAGKMYDISGNELKINPEHNVYALKTGSGFDFYRFAPDGDVQPISTK
jgi:hypothetical protein